MAGFFVERPDGERVESELMAAWLSDGLAGLPKDVLGGIGSVQFKGNGRSGRMRRQAIRGIESKVRDRSVFDDDAFEPRG